MNKTEDMKKAETTVLSLAFRVKDEGENLYSAEMLLIKGDKVVDKRSGVGTTLGHAIGAMDDLADGWACTMIETKAETFFKEVML